MASRWGDFLRSQNFSSRPKIPIELLHPCHTPCCVLQRAPSPYLSSMNLFSTHFSTTVVDVLKFPSITHHTNIIIRLYITSPNRHTQLIYCFYSENRFHGTNAIFLLFLLTFPPPPLSSPSSQPAIINHFYN